MTPHSASPGCAAACAMLKQRIACLNAPLFRVPPSGPASVALAAPGSEAIACPSLLAMVADAAREALGAGRPIGALFEGAWVAVIPPPDRRTDAGAVLLMGPRALAGEDLIALALESRVAPARAVELLRASCVHSDTTAMQIACLLRADAADLITAETGRSEIENLSARLADAYEEIGLLHTLGESVNSLAAPERFVQLACDELAAITPCAWTIALFDPSHPTVRTLPRCSFVGGDAPRACPDLDALRRALIPLVSVDDAPTLGRDFAPLVAAGFCDSIVRSIHREGETVGVLIAGGANGDEGGLTSVDVKRLDAAANSIAILLSSARMLEDMQAMFMGTLHALTSAIDAKDPYTRGHSERVAHLAHALSLRLGIDAATAERNRISGLVHDIGKIGVREDVLRKPGRLTDAEYAEMKRHPEIGHRILADIPQFDDVLPGVLHHHERFDGRGYPARLSAAQIPLQARIIGLADAFDAMSSTRTYRAALPRTKVLDEVRASAGTHFDPRLAAAFVEMPFDEYDRLVQRHLRLASDDSPKPDGLAA